MPLEAIVCVLGNISYSVVDDQRHK